MAFIADIIFDSGLSYATTNGTRMDICSSEPTTYAAATSTASLGNSSVTTGAPENGAVNGRRVQTAAITAGSVTGTGSRSDASEPCSRYKYSHGQHYAGTRFNRG